MLARCVRECGNDEDVGWLLFRECGTKKRKGKRERERGRKRSRVAPIGKMSHDDASSIPSVASPPVGGIVPLETAKGEVDTNGGVTAQTAAATAAKGATKEAAAKAAEGAAAAKAAEEATAKAAEEEATAKATEAKEAAEAEEAAEAAKAANQATCGLMVEKMVSWWLGWESVVQWWLGWESVVQWRLGWESAVQWWLGWESAVAATTICCVSVALVYQLVYSVLISV